MIGIQDRHAVDRACGIRSRSRVDDIVCADNKSDVRACKLGVDLVLVINNVVRHAGLRQQHIHMARHSSRDRVNRELDVDAAAYQ